jgi:hypothetical protein
MGFQTVVYADQAIGIPGTRYDDSPLRSISYILNSVEASYNVVGATAMTVASDGTAQAGSGGAGGFAGILANPEIQALFGAGGIPLNPSLTLNNGFVSAVVSMGRIFVTLPAAANVSDLVVYDNTTGALSTVPAGNPLPMGTTFACAQVIRYTLTGAGIGIIEIDPFLVAPT